MKTKVESSRRINKKFKNWVQELLTVFGPGVTYDNGLGFRKRYLFSRPVTRIRLLDEIEFDRALSRNGYAFLERGYEPPWESYEALEEGEAVNFTEFFRGLEQITLEMNPGCWRPILRYGRIGPTLDYDTEILLCPKRISSLADEIRNRLPEVKPEAVERLLFRVVLTHEIGHHFTLANYSAFDVVSIIENRDLNILEGLANWFAHAVLPKEERWVLAELATRLDISRRHYLYFKHSDISGLLDIFFSGTDYRKAPAALHKIIGGKMNLNGSRLVVETNFDSVAMDWSGRGGMIIAGEEIKGLATMNRGVFISPRIQLLIGRFPKKAIVVANEILNIADYEQLPENVKILPRDSTDLAEIIRRHVSKDVKTRIRSILDEVGLESVVDS